MSTQRPSITSWTRLEPRSRAADLAPALEARLADPLWVLTRQWQLGELQGEDAGSPVVARVRAHADRLTRYRAGSRNPVALPAGMPLEAAVERETAEQARDLRLAAEAGAELLRRLAAAGLGDLGPRFISAHPLRAPAGVPTGPPDAAYLRVLGGRVPDGLALRDAPRGANGLPTTVTIPAERVAAVKPVFDAWLSALGVSISTGATTEDAWLPDRMEYGFAIAGAGPTGETVLEATEYTGDSLDWSDLDAAGGTLGATASTATTESIVRTVIPTMAAYPGMPAARFWELEDAQMSFGHVSAEPTDLARLLLVEYASVYAVDHFLIPLDVPVGSVVHVDSLVVTDTFGEQMLIPPAAAPGDWALFRPSRAGGAPPPMLVILPTVTDAIAGPPVEAVVLQRDEMANMAWAVEQTVAGPAGHPYERHEQEARSAPSPPDPAGTAELHYTLQTPVPAHWLPLLPVEHAPGSIVLKLVPQERRGPGGTVVPLPPLGWLLSGGPLEIPEEEVPQAGVRVLRHWQLARWVDGSTHLWLGRAKEAGRGPAASGLRFDAVQPRDGAS